MADSSSDFTFGWIAANVLRDPAFDGDIASRASRTLVTLKRDARSAGLDMSDPELDDHLLLDDISDAIESTRDPMVGGIGDRGSR